MKLILLLAMMASLIVKEIEYAIFFLGLLIYIKED